MQHFILMFKGGHVAEVAVPSEVATTAEILFILLGHNVSSSGVVVFDTNLMFMWAELVGIKKIPQPAGTQLTFRLVPDQSYTKSCADCVAQDSFGLCASLQQRLGECDIEGKWHFFELVEDEESK